MPVTDIAQHPLTRFATRSSLSEADRAALDGLPLSMRQYPRHTRFVREGDRPLSCGVIVSGCAMRSKTTAAGGRQIAVLLIAGGFVGLPFLALPRADHDIEALSPLRLAEIPLEPLRRLALDRPAIAQALWADTLVEASVARELLLNNCRRDATQRIAHQLCEFALRFGNGEEPALSLEIPLTQEQLGDLLGLTAVHVNRTLRALRETGAIEQRGRLTVISDWRDLQQLGGFTPTYLHREAERRAVA